MGKIKLRELIDNLYAGEEIPQKLKHNEKIWLWDEMECFYKLENGTAGLFGTIFDFYNDIDALDTELEIIEEEESDEIKKIPSWTTQVGRVDESNIEDYIHLLFSQQEQLFYKINELINNLKKGDKHE